MSKITRGTKSITGKTRRYKTKRNINSKKPRNNK